MMVIVVVVSVSIVVTMIAINDSKTLGHSGSLAGQPMQAQQHWRKVLHRLRLFSFWGLGAGGLA